MNRTLAARLQFMTLYPLDCYMLRWLSLDRRSLAGGLVRDFREGNRPSGDASCQSTTTKPCRDPICLVLCGMRAVFVRRSLARSHSSCAHHSDRLGSNAGIPASSGKVSKGAKTRHPGIGRQCRRSARTNGYGFMSPRPRLRPPRKLSGLAPSMTNPAAT
jgi:hypothetical protein